MMVVEPKRTEGKLVLSGWKRDKIEIRSPTHTSSFNRTGMGNKSSARLHARRFGPHPPRALGSVGICGHLTSSNKHFGNSRSHTVFLAHPESLWSLVQTCEGFLNHATLWSTGGKLKSHQVRIVSFASFPSLQHALYLSPPKRSLYYWIQRLLPVLFLGHCMLVEGSFWETRWADFLNFPQSQEGYLLVSARLSCEIGRAVLMLSTIPPSYPSSGSFNWT